MQKEMKLRDFIERLKQGDFESKDVHAQIEAGWYDWFCRDESLAKKTKRMGNIVKQLKDGGKVNLETMYVWFKNNCPLAGPLYDDFRIADIETGDTLFTIAINCFREGKRYTLYCRKNDFIDPLFETDKSRELINWFNEGWLKMYKEYNAHPKGLKTSDCVVRAIATATNSDYMETRRELNRSKRELGYTSYKDTKFIYDYFKCYPRLIFKPVKGEPRIKGSDFSKLHPKGIYILKMAGHITVCVNGVILDTWDCSYLSVYTTWLIKNINY